MRFDEMKYERPMEQDVRNRAEELLKEMEKAGNAADFLAAFRLFEKLFEHVDTMCILCQIRHTINTVDPFYEKENDYWDEAMPRYEELKNRMKQLACEKEYRKDLEKDIPEVFFLNGEYAMKSFKPEIIPLLARENQLASAYGKLKASAEIPFDGKVLNLSEIQVYLESTDRETRKQADAAKWKFYADHEAEFDDLYDQMVQVRTEMAHKLGFEDYHKLSFYLMNRYAYTPEMVSAYRKKILDYVTPAAAELGEKQRVRLGLERLESYDSPLQFKDGNPKPQGNAEELVAAAVKMYHEMSEETGKFIDVMNDNHLWDLISRKNKEMGGYETEIPEYGVPFIFSNFNGTSGDVDVLTHEAGHAFQTYMGQDIATYELRCPTMEAAEVDSMSMEFFAYPWMELFFGKQARRYRYSHMTGTLTFLPYGVLVDHFQEEVYTHPEMTKEERKACWRKLEKMYLPFKHYDDNAFLEKGCWWYSQNHIFQSPFYYIDYTLAQVCAQEFGIRMLENDKTYWQDYLKLLKKGGTQVFPQLVEESGIASPFEGDTVKHVTEKLMAHLEETDDTRL